MLRQRRRGDDVDRSRGLLERAKNLEETSFRKFWTLVVETASILKEVDGVKRKPWMQHIIDDLYEKQRGKCGICKKSMQRFRVTAHPILVAA